MQTGKRVRKALVTGGSRGIGAACCRALARDGWYVYVNYNKSRDKALALAEEIGGTAVWADVSDVNAVKAMFETVGDVELLVNNAGIAHGGLLTDLSPADWQRLFDVNITGVYNCSRAAIPHMVHEKRGHIISLASILGVSGGSCEVAYSATKGAVIAFTKALAKELGPSGIRVNCVAPGCIDTDMTANLTKADFAALAEDTAMCRIGRPEDVADVIALMADPGARFMTGQVIGVDGGLVI